jgi:hypothetical protein
MIPGEYVRPAPIGTATEPGSLRSLPTFDCGQPEDNDAVGTMSAADFKHAKAKSDGNRRKRSKGRS